MAGWTNKGKARVLKGFFRNVNVPTSFYLALCTSAITPVPDINTFSELTEIAAGNGYTAGGLQVLRNTVDWDQMIEDDINDIAYIQVKDIVWTASGGPIPASGSGARWAVLLDDNATLGSREVICWWDLVTDRQVSDGQTLTLQNIEIRLIE
jgi:hypothetical protein